jgi:hypothetical protein
VATDVGPTNTSTGAIALPIDQPTASVEASSNSTAGGLIFVTRTSPVASPAAPAVGARLLVIGLFASMLAVGTLV